MRAEIVCLLAICAISALAGDDTKLTTTQLIADRGYKFEEHTAQTSDGYVLGLVRIPNPGKPAVVLQHGLLDTAATWVINGPKESLGYILFDAGYDVFLCNSRGNKYSLKHVSLNPSSSDFWKFDWDHHATLDVPACVEKAKAVSKQPTVVYIGHSQGGTIGFAALTTTKIASSVSGFVALAPVTYLKTQRSKLFGLMAKIQVDKVLEKVPPTEFIPLPDKLSKLLGGLCAKTPGLCGDALSTLFGDMTNVDKARMGVYTAHWPDRTSVQNMIHWIQSARAGTFPAMNGKSIYNPSTITVPTAIYYGTKDSLGDTADEETLIAAVKRSGKLSDSAAFPFGHMDFVWAGKSAVSTVYPKVLEQVKKFTSPISKTK